MNSHQDHNNTTTRSIGTLPPIKSIKTLKIGVKQYQNITYQPASLLTTPEYTTCASPYRFIKPIYNNWFRHLPTLELVNSENSMFLHDYQRHILADPLGNNLCPIIDGLSITIDVPEEGLDELGDAIKNHTFNGFKLVRTGPTSFLKNSSEVYEEFALFKNKQGCELLTFWGLSDSLKSARPNQRLFKLYKNPARFAEEEIHGFYSSLKTSYSFDYDELMPIANVPRIDTALDMCGFHISNLIVDKPKVTIINYYQNELPDGSKVLGTFKLGSPSDSTLTGYDKSFKLFKNNPANIPLLHYKSGQLVPISRLERKYKTSDGKAVSLKTLGDTPYFLSDTEFYSPIVIRELSRNERKLVQQTGFLNWLHVLASDNRRDFILEFINANKLWVNHEILSELQRKQLQILSNVILGV